jgi:hypothetical protein
VLTLIAHTRYDALNYETEDRQESGDHRYGVRTVWEAIHPFHWVVIAVVALLSGVTAVGVYRSASSLRAYRREILDRAEALRIRRMLERLGVKLPNYLRRVASWNIERHLMKCERCQTTADCDRYLDQGANLDPHAFCPNFAELKRLGRGR